MGNATILALRVVIALAVAGSLVVQTMIVPALWVDLEGEAPWAQFILVAIVFLGVVTMQVFAVCVWQLLTKVRHGSVFSRSSFVYVNIIVGAILAAAALVFTLAVLLAPGETAPGIVGLVCGASLVLGGMALLVVVMKTLLRQAIDRETEAKALRAELDEVV
jgi:protein-S-isoprenylcysteine O-methyltransferase Ste14